MLRELHIENFAVIENATVQLGDMLNVFTGETGAGKSILIGGINAVLGQRVSKDIVREGTERAYVSAVFTDIPNSVCDKLTEYGLSDGDELIVSRVINADGRNSARINSRPVNISVLREIGDLLVNIHGQHDSQVLLDPAKHLGILDGFAESDKLLFDYQASFKELQSCAREIQKAKTDAKTNFKREQYLQQIIDDIGALEISENEDAAVDERFRVLDNAVTLSEAVRTAVNLLSGDGESDGSEALAAKACTELEIIEDFLPQIKPISERLANAGIELGDISSELSHMLSDFDIDENEYARLTQRRNDLQRIKRRYGPTLGDVLKIYNDSLEEMAGISVSDEYIEKLEERKSALLSEVTKKAEALSKHRNEAAQRFTKSVISELEFLNMPSVKITVSSEKGKLTLSGMDNIEFLISANRGESPKPLAKIASGGELSRIMLALKTVLADRDLIPTLIFDEIDAGVSGRAAQKIGIKLREISRKRQVLCVTHLPQIAIMADNHLLIEKQVVSERTVTEIKSLGFDERKYEIARILGGDNITDTVLKDAEEQLISVMKGE